MSKPAMGARVMYCGHAGWFIADIYLVAGANVVRATEPVTTANLNRKALKAATHHVSDAKAGFWRPDLGVFVVPEDEVREVKNGKVVIKDYNA